MKSVTAIIPVRSGSVRCPHKNLRSFSDTSLLELKISQLKKVKNIDNIVVSSSDSKSLNIARRLGVCLHERDPFFSTSDTTGSELYKCLADAVQSEHMMYVTCVSPFVHPETYENAIELYFSELEKGTHDSVVCSEKVKEFLWLDKQPLNYNPMNAPPSQLLPDIYAITFGFNILSTKLVREKCSIVGRNPFFYEVSKLEGIDIDDKSDFIIAELLYANAFYRDADINSHSLLTEKRKFMLLDCTIRDGGYNNNWNFSYEQVLDIYKAVSKTGIEYLEIGFICNNVHMEDYGKWWNVSEHDIEDLITDYPNGCKLAAMINLQDTCTLKTKIHGLDMIRVLVNPRKNDIINHDQLKANIRDIIALGYTVTLNIAYIDILTKSELDNALSLIVPGVEYVYLADTFGSMSSSSMKSTFRYIKQHYNGMIGFHGHNNTQNAISNSLDAIRNGASIIDVTIQGFGRGGGNTPLEIFLQHVNHNFNTKYDILPALDLLDKTYSLSTSQQLCILHTLTGLHKLHPNIANDYLENSLTLLSTYQKIIKDHVISRST
jgi:CMP-N-acetylneuraminic acid synthetase